MFAGKQVSHSSPLRLVASWAFIVGLSLGGTATTLAHDTSTAVESAHAEAPVESGTSTESATSTTPHSESRPAESTTPHSGKVNRPLLIVGAALFIGSYGPSLAFATLGDWNTDDALVVPVAGPWMSLANSDSQPLSKALLINSGVMQGLGVLAIIASFIVPR